MKYVNLTVTTLPEPLEEKAILTLFLEIREHWCVCCSRRRRWMDVTSPFYVGISY
jgi:hypothetical protein